MTEIPSAWRRAVARANHRERFAGPERRLWDAYPTGTRVDLGDDRPERATPDRTVRAEVITALLLGAREPRPGRVPAVRLRGAYITGRLDVTGGTVGCELRLEKCHLEEPPRFANAATRQLRLSECRMPGFDGGGLHADGYLSLSGSVIEGEVRLVRANLTGGFRMNRTRISNGGERAIFAGGLTVDAGTFWRNAEINGHVRLTGARMGGGFFLYGATLREPGGIALDGENMVVEDRISFSRGCTVHGMLRLRSVRVNGTLSFSDGVLRAPDHVALHLSQAQVYELLLQPREPVEGIVSLMYARIDVINDREEIWPAALRLDGLTYETLRGTPDDRRLHWVSRDPFGFRPQPYEQLADWYRRIGRDDMARRCQLAKQRARRPHLGPFSRAWGWVLDWTVGYGYRPWIAALWLALLLAVGTTVFGLDHPHTVRQPDERPHFNAFVYTLDLMLPIETFGQRSAWDPRDWSQWLAYGLTGAGWILATALIAGTTRILRRG